MKCIIALAIICEVLTCVLFSNSCAAYVKSKRVLVLFSDHYGIRFQELFKKGLTDKMMDSRDFKIDFLYEYLDMDKYTSLAFEKYQADILRSKYHSSKADLVIAFFKPAIDLIRKYGNYIGLSGPYICCTSSYIQNRTNDIFIVFEKIDFKGTVETALKLLPGTRHIAVIAGNNPLEIEYSQNIGEDLKGLDKNIDIIWLTNLSSEVLLDKVVKLPPDSFILMSTFSRSDPFNILNLIHSRSHVPFFTTSDVTIGTGTTGGVMISYEHMGNVAGEAALHMLRGEKISEIKIQDKPKYALLFDWRELKRWGISTAKLPPGSIVMFREHSFLEKYFPAIITVTAIVLMESLLIIFLFINIVNRKTAQQALKDSEEKYRRVIDESFEGIMVTDETGRIISWNRTMEKFSGIKTIDAIGQNIWDIILSLKNIKITPNLPEDVKKSLMETLETGNSALTERVYEEKVLIKGVSKMVLESRLFSIATDKGHMLIGIVVNITGRKKALEEKEALLRELYHRTQNNMQVINSLLNLETSFSNDANLKNIFEDMENRIHSMALVHHKLYQSKDLTNIYIKEYINDLISRLKSVYRNISSRVKLLLDIENLPLQIDSAVPFGLILNELLSNAYKHAFPKEREGEIRISLHKSTDGVIELMVSDNGIGVSDGFDFRKNNRMGLQSIFWIGEQQLLGSVIFESHGGVKCTIRFNEIKVPPRV